MLWSILLLAVVVHGTQLFTSFVIEVLDSDVGIEMKGEETLFIFIFWGRTVSFMAFIVQFVIFEHLTLLSICCSHPRTTLTLLTLHPAPWLE